MSVPIFISKLLAVVSANVNGQNTDPNLFRSYFDFYNLKLANLDEAVKQYNGNGTPIAPEMQLVFNLEDLLDDVYRRAKEAARIEILTELEFRQAINIFDESELNEGKSDISRNNDKSQCDTTSFAGGKLSIDIDDL